MKRRVGHSRTRSFFDYRNRLRSDHPKCSYCLQYRESDLAFIERLLAEEGINYHYTHGPDPSLRPAGPLDPRRDSGAISLFVHGVKDKISLKLIAAQGKVQMQAQHGEIEVTAEQDVTVTSTKQKITLPANKEILLTSGGAYIRIKDGNIELHCPGTLSIKGASKILSGPDSMQVPMPQFPSSVCLECLKARAISGAALVKTSAGMNA